MGFVRAKVIIGNPSETHVEEVEFLADSSAFDPIIPPKLAKRLGIKPVMEKEYTLANKRKAGVGAHGGAPLGIAYFKLLDREGGFLVGIMDVPEPLLGVTVFEGLGIRIDPTTGKLEHSRPYGLAII